jgi:Fibronectin type III domain
MAIREAPPAPPPTGPRRPDRRRARWIFVLAAAAALGLVAGLMVWAPWHKVPVPPAAVQARSPTATSVLVSWAPSRGGATIDRYLVLRDGAQVGSVSASRTSYVDNGLAPGTTHRYTIIAASGTERSHPSSVSAVVRTITPSPVGLAAGPATSTTVAFHWSPSPNGPVPDRYLIFGEGANVVTLPGTTTSYNATGLVPDTTYTFQVAAMWGGQQSDWSSVLVVSTLTPPISAARLLGPWSTQYKIIKMWSAETGGSGGTFSVGQGWTDSWSFSPKCAAGPCAVVLSGVFTGPGNYAAMPFTVTLARAGAVYTGTTAAHITSCGQGTGVPVHNTLTFRITVSKAGVADGTWTASSWDGTMVLSSPYTSAGAYYCPAQSLTAALSGSP